MYQTHAGAQVSKLRPKRTARKAAARVESYLYTKSGDKSNWMCICIIVHIRVMEIPYHFNRMIPLVVVTVEVILVLLPMRC